MFVQSSRSHIRSVRSSCDTEAEAQEICEPSSRAKIASIERKCCELSHKLESLHALQEAHLFHAYLKKALRADHINSIFQGSSRFVGVCKNQQLDLTMPPQSKYSAESRYRFKFDRHLNIQQVWHDDKPCSVADVPDLSLLNRCLRKGLKLDVSTELPFHQEYEQLCKDIRLHQLALKLERRKYLFYTVTQKIETMFTLIEPHFDHHEFVYVSCRETSYLCINLKKKKVDFVEHGKVVLSFDLQNNQVAYIQGTSTQDWLSIQNVHSASWLLMKHVHQHVHLNQFSNASYVAPLPSSRKMVRFTSKSTLV